MIKTPKLFTTLLALVLLFSNAVAQSEKNRVANYIDQYKDLAMAEMIRTGIPASITLAQGILETAGGQSDLASQANNHFGIKCKTEWTGDRMYHDDDAKGECFRKYNSAEESYKDHSDFLRTRAPYAFLFKLDPTDFEGWAKGLKKAGYATNPAYPQRLMKIIMENNLQQYTLLALQQQQGREQELFTTNIDKQEKMPDANPSTISVHKIDEPEILNEAVVAASTGASSPRPLYSYNKVFTINDTKVVYAEAGTSLLALANNFNVTLKKLIEFNDIDQDDIIKHDQLVFIERKSKHGAKDVHVVEPNETLHDIVQKEGVQLQSVLEYNRMQKGNNPAVGEKIYLKALSPSTPRLATSTSAGKQVVMK